MSVAAATSLEFDSPASWMPTSMTLARAQRVLDAQMAAPFERERREQIIRVATQVYLDHVRLVASAQPDQAPASALVANGLLAMSNDVLLRVSREQLFLPRCYTALASPTPWQIAQALIRIDGVRWDRTNFLIGPINDDEGRDQAVVEAACEPITAQQVRIRSRAYDPFMTIRKAGSVRRFIQEDADGPGHPGRL